MPRTAAADAAVSIHAGGPQRLRPPDDLAAGSPERKLFVEIVVSLPASHFHPCHAPLLAAYCRAICLEQTASSELQACGYVIDGGKPSGWLNVYGLAQRSITTLSSKLKLNPLSRQASTATPERDEGSHYEKMNLLDRRHAEPN
jgi:phage terminase small subunit